MQDYFIEKGREMENCSCGVNKEFMIRGFLLCLSSNSDPAYMRLMTTHRWTKLLATCCAISFGSEDRAKY